MQVVGGARGREASKADVGWMSPEAAILAVDKDAGLD